MHSQSISVCPLDLILHVTTFAEIELAGTVQVHEDLLQKSTSKFAWAVDLVSVCVCVYYGR